MSTFNPPPRNAAAYGEPWRRHMCTTVIQPARSCTHTHPVYLFFYTRTITMSQTYNRNMKLEFAGNIYTGFYICTGCPLWFPSSLIFTLSLLFSPADPIFAVLWYREVMMRNGVIMPVVKPQAAQQMCFRDLAFVSEWIRSLLWYPLYLISLQSLPATLCFSW